MGFSRQEYWSGLSGPPPGDFPDRRTEPPSLKYPTLVTGSFPLVPPERPKLNPVTYKKDYTLSPHKIPHSSTLAWKIPWTEEPGGLQATGSRRVGHDRATSLSLFTFMHWRRKWQPTPVFLPGESQGREPGGLPSMGSHRVGHD